MMGADSILSQVKKYYSEKIRTHGPTARGVDWNSQESQQLRFTQLLKLIDHDGAFTVNDFGCGYGALADYLKRNGYNFRYTGFDISPEMTASAKELNPDMDFIGDKAELREADYTLASGIFNVKLNTLDEDWTNYMMGVLDTINSLSKIGFAFNALTKYSDAEFMRGDLYYADPLFFFDHCKTRYSRFVALLHDYQLYEFTILVRKV